MEIELFHPNDLFIESGFFFINEGTIKFIEWMKKHTKTDEITVMGIRL